MEDKQVELYVQAVNVAANSDGVGPPLSTVVTAAKASAVAHPGVV